MSKRVAVESVKRKETKAETVKQRYSEIRRAKTMKYRKAMSRKKWLKAELWKILRRLIRLHIDSDDVSLLLWL